MKTLFLLIFLSLSTTIYAEAKQGPRVTGNGGGGVQENGVYKTFYSAGLYIKPIPEKEIPGLELYKKTIMDLSGGSLTTSTLLSTALPFNNRKYYKVLADKMDDVVMSRLLEEYARVVNQPVQQLTIFAITDINAKVTYLLPSFYSLSEVEQAAIIFHEAYWIMNPKANYAEVIEAEATFQRFLELKSQGEFDLELPNLIGRLLNDPSFALKSSFQEDQRSKILKNVINPNGTINIKDLFINKLDSCIKYKNSVVVNKYGLIMKRTFVYCTMNKNNIHGLLEYTRNNPESHFFKQLLNYLNDENSISVQFSGASSGDLTLKDIDYELNFMNTDLRGTILIQR